MSSSSYFSRKQGSVLCFCAAPHEEGTNRRKGTVAAEAEEAMKIADCLQESNEGQGESPRRGKRRELFLCLPPSPAPFAACDAYSPRRFMSRLLLPLRWSSPVGSESGGNGEGVRFRVRFPRCGGSNRKGRETMEEEEEEEEEKGKSVAKEEELDVEINGGRNDHCASEDTGNIGSSDSSSKIAIDSVKKNDELLPLNLGMGVGLVLLLARSTTEIDKMVELRQQMEILLRDIKDEIQTQSRKKDTVSSNSAESNNHASSSISKSYEYERSSNCNLSQEHDIQSYHLKNTHNAMSDQEAEAQMMNSRAASKVRRRLEMDQMEAEFQVELERLQRTMKGKISSLLPNQERVELDQENPHPCESIDASLAEAYDAYNEGGSSSHCGVSAQELTRRLNQLLEARQQEGVAELESSFYCTGYSNNDADVSETCSEDNGEVTQAHEEGSLHYCGVPARELERRLHELLETRQQERIAELESALQSAERNLREREREICWWRDTARLVSQHKNETLNR